MDWEIIDGYRFEVGRNNNSKEVFVEVDSLGAALANMSSDGLLRAVYNLRIGDRYTDEYKIELLFKDIAPLNKQQILDLIEQEIKIKHNQ